MRKILETKTDDSYVAHPLPIRFLWKFLFCLIPVIYSNAKVNDEHFTCILRNN